MTKEAFESALSRLDLSGAIFGMRLGVHRNAVSAWRTGRRPVPGYVEEYLRAMLLIKEALG